MLVIVCKEALTEFHLLQTVADGAAGHGNVAFFQRLLHQGRLLVTPAVFLVVEAVVQVQRIADVGHGGHGVEQDVVLVDLVKGLQDGIGIFTVFHQGLDAADGLAQGVGVRTFVNDVGKARFLPQGSVGALIFRIGRMGRGGLLAFRGIGRRGRRELVQNIRKFV